MDKTESSYFGGNYHSEGFDKEYIKAVALYYFDISENVEGGGLSFMDPTYRHFGSSGTQSIRIKDNDCVFFTNSKPYKHKVDAMKIMNKENMKNIDDGNKDKNGKQIFGT